MALYSSTETINEQHVEKGSYVLSNKLSSARGGCFMGAGVMGVQVMKEKESNDF